MIKYPIFFLTGQWWHIWNGSVPIEFLHYIPCSPAAAFWMADLRLRSEDTTRKISQNKHSQAAAAHSSHRRRWRRINQTLHSELCGLERREITLSPSAWLQDSGTGDRVAECIQCLWCVVVCGVQAIREYFLLQWILARERWGARTPAHCCQARQDTLHPRLVQGVQWATGIRTEKIRDKWRYGDTYKHGEARVGAWDHLSVCLGAAAWPPLYCPTRSES